MNYFRSFIRSIPPKTLIYLSYAVSAWLVFSGLGELIAVWPELFSGEQVANFW